AVLDELAVEDDADLQHLLWGVVRAGSPREQGFRLPVVLRHRSPGSMGKAAGPCPLGSYCSEGEVSGAHDDEVRRTDVVNIDRIARRPQPKCLRTIPCETHRGHVVRNAVRSWVAAESRSRQYGTVPLPVARSIPRTAWAESPTKSRYTCSA